MIHRFLLVCVLTLLSGTGCASGADGRAEAPVAAGLLAVFEPAADPADARRRARVAGLRTDDHGVLVDITTAELVAGDRDRFAREGVVVRHFSVEYQRVAASVRDLSALRAVARIDVVRNIAPEYGTADDDAGGGGAY